MKYLQHIFFQVKKRKVKVTRIVRNLFCLLCGSMPIWRIHFLFGTYITHMLMCCTQFLSQKIKCQSYMDHLNLLSCPLYGSMLILIALRGEGTITYQDLLVYLVMCSSYAVRDIVVILTCSDCQRQALSCLGSELLRKKVPAIRTEVPCWQLMIRTEVIFRANKWGNVLAPTKGLTGSSCTGNRQCTVARTEISFVVAP